LTKIILGKKKGESTIGEKQKKVIHCEWKEKEKKVIRKRRKRETTLYFTSVQDNNKEKEMPHIIGHLVVLDHERKKGEKGWELYIEQRSSL
jgi:hypothetical protein